MLDESATSPATEDAEEVEKAAGRSAKIRVVPEGSPWNEVELAMLQRRSIRKFRRAQVPAHLVRRMLEMGRFAPSQGNCQPWKFVVIRDAEMIQDMEDHCVAACRKLSEGFDYTTQPAGSLQRTHHVRQGEPAQPPAAEHAAPGADDGRDARSPTGRFAVFHKAPTVILLLMDKRGIGTPGDRHRHLRHQHRAGRAELRARHLLGRLLQAARPRAASGCARLGVEDPYEISEAISVGYPVGDPTHLISRETHEIAWFEGGKKEILF